MSGKSMDWIDHSLCSFVTEYLEILLWSWNLAQITSGICINKHHSNWFISLKLGLVLPILDFPQGPWGQSSSAETNFIKIK